MRLVALLLLFGSIPALAQLPGTKTPIILVNGYQLECNAGSPSTSTFGELESLLRQDGYPVHFFNNCAVPPSTGNRPTIEELGQALGSLVASLNVSEVDIVAHSMGSLITRAYLAGKQPGTGRFTPPAERRIRKFVTLGASNFGFTGPLVALAPDIQAQAQIPGSRFLLELATWNQGTDDLREVDAIAVVGAVAGGSTDGLVAITSATLPNSPDPERTRVIPYCHTSGLTLFGCRPNDPLLANVTSREHLSYRIISSFLEGTDQWRRVGESAAANATLSRSNGVILNYRSANDDIVSDITRVAYSGGTLDRLRENFYFKEALPPGQYTFDIQSPTRPAKAEWTAKGGTYSVLSVKEGPQILLVIPAAARVPTLGRSAGSFISIYGSSLAQATEQANALPLPEQLGGVSVLADGRTIPLQYVSSTQINAVLPETLSGLVPLTVRAPSGSHTINLLMETAVPAVFSINGGGSGPAAAINALTGTVISETAPARAGDIVALYATGLGPVRADGGLSWAVHPPVVTLRGVECQVVYAGRTSQYPGLDQINFVVPAGLGSGAIPLVVRTLQRTSNETTLALR